jgi:hypothetical protein
MSLKIKNEESHVAQLPQSEIMMRRSPACSREKLAQPPFLDFVPNTR